MDDKQTIRAVLVGGSEPEEINLSSVISKLISKAREISQDPRKRTNIKRIKKSLLEIVSNIQEGYERWFETFPFYSEKGKGLPVFWSEKLDTCINRISDLFLAMLRKTDGKQIGDLEFWNEWRVMWQIGFLENLNSLEQKILDDLKKEWKREETEENNIGC